MFFLSSVLLIVCGIFINGPYGLITTAVSSDLVRQILYHTIWQVVVYYLLNLSFQGTHPTLSNNQNAKATVTAIIDGTGSIGAAVGPLLIGWLTDSYVRLLRLYVLSVCISTTLSSLFHPCSPCGGSVDMECSILCTDGVLSSLGIGELDHVHNVQLYDVVVWMYCMYIATVATPCGGGEGLPQKDKRSVCLHTMLCIYGVCLTIVGLWIRS